MINDDDTDDDEVFELGYQNPKHNLPFACIDLEELLDDRTSSDAKLFMLYIRMHATREHRYRVTMKELADAFGVRVNKIRGWETELRNIGFGNEEVSDYPDSE